MSCCEPLLSGQRNGKPHAPGNHSRTWRSCLLQNWLSSNIRSRMNRRRSSRIHFNLSRTHGFLWSTPKPDMTVDACCNDAVFFKPKPADRVIINNLVLLQIHQQRALMDAVDRLTMTGGSSAVLVLDSTGCSSSPSPSTLSAVRFEFDRNLIVAWLSVRLRDIGTCDEMLALWRTES